MIPIPDWKVTATTIHCEAVDNEVTVLVYQDWSTKCTGYAKYHAPDKLPGKKAKQTGQRPECSGPTCSHVAQYKEKLAAEEAEKALSSR